jgi:polyether ionophore transport system permease protein
MTADVALRAGVPVLRRIYGLGSIFGKTLRDSRRAMIIATIFFAAIWLITGAAVDATFATPEARAELIAVTKSLPPILLGLYGGTQENVVSIGGFANWRYGFVMMVFPSVWSILALSGTLVTESRRGSMDLVAASPIARWSVATQKFLGHVVALTISMALVGLVAWAVSGATATLTSEEIAALGGTGTDAIPIGSALSQSLLMGMVALASGAIAFGLAPFVGRGGAATMAGVVMAGSWVIYGYRDAIPLFDSLKPVSWYWWTHGFRPLAGSFDWSSLVPLTGVVVMGGLVGVVAFARRDLGAVGSLRLPSLPGALRGIGGPLGRSVSERFPAALGWGIPLGLMALLIASSAEELRDAVANSPAIIELFALMFPNVDINEAGFGLQFAFLVFGFLGAGMAAATLMGGWASDEGEGRLEMVLATAMARARWFVASALGVYLAIALVAVVVAGGVAIGLLSLGEDPLTAVAGTAVLALYGLALAGIGFALAGWLRSSFGPVVAAAVAVATILLDIIVPALQLPDWMHDLALTAHYGEPMVGNWDSLGVSISLGLAVFGLAIGAWGFARRDLKS